MLVTEDCLYAVASMGEPGAAEEAQRMRHVLSNLLRDDDTAKCVEWEGAAAVASDDLSMVDGQDLDGASDLDSADLDALLESQVDSWPCPRPPFPRVPVPQRLSILQRLSGYWPHPDPSSCLDEHPFPARHVTLNRMYVRYRRGRCLCGTAQC